MRHAIFVLMCLVSAASGAFGQLRTATVPEEIFYNGKIVTVDAAFSVEQALAVRGEEILAVGSSAEVRRRTNQNTHRHISQNPRIAGSRVPSDPLPSRPWASRVSR